MTATLALESRATRLRPPTPGFVEELYTLAAVGEIPWQWNAATETPQSFAEAFWDGVLVQFAIEDRRDGRPVGLISAYNANLFHGYAYASLTLLPDHRLKVWPLEGALVFANYLFTRYNLRNVYAESAEPSFLQFRSGSGDFFEVEGQLRERLVVNGEPRDLYILRVSRERWQERGAELLARCQP